MDNRHFQCKMTLEVDYSHQSSLDGGMLTVN